ncbi:MAG: protein BatD [Bacteroidetes bacterium]|nr:protein BatD [Bacteroidota bacterium]MBL6944826.1 protein BatD [Bacteroidales bacterium]
MIKQILILSLLITLAFPGLSNDQVNFTGKAKQVVKVGESFRVIYEVNKEASNFQSPDFKSLQVLSGPSTSSNSSIQYVNGKMTQNYSMSYTYIVQAVKEGDVVINPATVTVDGKNVKSNSIKITVVKGATSQQGNTNQNKSNQPSETGILQDDDVYIRATVSNNSPFIGQQLILTYKIYTKVPVSNLMVKKLSSFQGFWSKSLLEGNNQYQQKTEIISGEEYIVAEINKFAIFPQKTGKLTIEPSEMECNVQLRVQSNRKRGYDPFDDFFNDPFFNRNVKNIVAVLKSNSVTVTVKPLPQLGKPKEFSGAVGDFRLSSRIDRTNLNANDAVTLTYTISGNGNLELINLPEVRFPVDFESFDPKITSNIKTTDTGISGKKTFEYLTIPRNAGDFEIMPVTLSYFNPADNKYHSVSSEKYEIYVSKSDISSNGISYSSSAQEDIRFIGKDIQHIKTPPFKFKPQGEFLFLSNAFFILLILPIISMIIIIIVIKQLGKRKSNVGLMKNRKANKVAKSRLKTAEKYKTSGDDNAYYDEIAQALWGYIADKFSLKQSELSIETVIDLLKEQDVENSISESFINTLNNIEFARFAPGDSRDKMESIYDESVIAIMQAEQALK